MPYSIIKTKTNIDTKTFFFPLIIFTGIGAGFMILEISLFQKLILYLGSPTLSLSILLGSLLVGMGLGSYFSRKIFGNSLIKKIFFANLIIILSGVLLYTLIPLIFDPLLAYSLLVRSIVSLAILIPLGFFLGIPFPATIQLLIREELRIFIPWMYGINCSMTVLGSVLAVIISMTFGFTFSFYLGLLFYTIVFAVTTINLKRYA